MCHSGMVGYNFIINIDWLYSFFTVFPTHLSAFYNRLWIFMLDIYLNPVTFSLSLLTIALHSSTLFALLYLLSISHSLDVVLYFSSQHERGIYLMSWCCKHYHIATDPPILRKKLLYNVYPVCIIFFSPHFVWINIDIIIIDMSLGTVRGLLIQGHSRRPKWKLRQYKSNLQTSKRWQVALALMSPLEVHGAIERWQSRKTPTLLLQLINT